MLCLCQTLTVLSHHIISSSVILTYRIFCLLLVITRCRDDCGRCIVETLLTEETGELADVSYTRVCVCGGGGGVRVSLYFTSSLWSTFVPLQFLSHRSLSEV